MARLEELVNPTELLAEIKNGSTKNELIKKYRTSEQELAMMLLPMYRRNEMTKEEFNSFFQGISLKVSSEDNQQKKSDAQPVEPQRPEDEPPSEILQRLSNLFHRKSASESKQAPKEEPVLAEKTVEPEPEADVQNVSPQPVNAEPTVAVMQQAESTSSPDREIAEETPQVEPRVSKPLNSAELAQLVNKTLARINAIETRLKNLEKKIGLE
ncbi:hypothetical protein [Desulfomonile tiedjei]|uniref:Uncharacterized protein n=1 Tax=Desulfomonile tiedjei (strain ATCC 49306 / DSM 6799 / DCB-1) TaxID=706587 RepID=I4C097_DESTA|nr:hypothetical protein [Desulfomonile tiedjei]AFM22988.1 hypothetical protein Desti_0242 [Desulfomonile tiedjei DSM 6799]